MDVAPLGVVGAHRGARGAGAGAGAEAGIEHDAARGVGDVDAQVQRALVQAPDLDVDRAPAVGREVAGQRRVHQRAAGRHRAQRGSGLFGDQIGGVGQDVLHHLARARFDLALEHLQREEAGQAGDDEEREQQSQAEAHRGGGD